MGFDFDMGMFISEWFDDFVELFEGFVVYFFGVVIRNCYCE